MSFIQRLMYLILFLKQGCVEDTASLNYKSRLELDSYQGCYFNQIVDDILHQFILFVFVQI